MWTRSHGRGCSLAKRWLPNPVSKRLSMLIGNGVTRAIGVIQTQAFLGTPSPLGPEYKRIQRAASSQARGFHRDFNKIGTNRCLLFTLLVSYRFSICSRFMTG